MPHKVGFGSICNSKCKKVCPNNPSQYVVISSRCHKLIMFCLLILLCSQIFWRVANNTLWFTYDKWLWSQSLVSLFGLPRPHRNTISRYCILFYGNLPKEVRSNDVLWNKHQITLCQWPQKYIFSPILCVHKWQNTIPKLLP